jgi:hypothetical protein
MVVGVGVALSIGMTPSGLASTTRGTRSANTRALRRTRSRSNIDQNNLGGQPAELEGVREGGSDVAAADDGHTGWPSCGRVPPVSVGYCMFITWARRLSFLPPGA